MMAELPQLKSALHCQPSIRDGIGRGKPNPASNGF